MMRNRKALAILLTIAAAAVSGSAASARPLTAPAARQAVHALAAPATHDVAACSRGYYQNAYGRCVHSPSNNPAGATARCRDGTYSYSQHASGTCSHHGGVARWIHHP
jgi:Protein of unknown function (DUF3761)